MRQLTIFLLIVLFTATLAYWIRIRNKKIKDDSDDI